MDELFSGGGFIGLVVAVVGAGAAWLLLTRPARRHTPTPPPPDRSAEDQAVGAGDAEAEQQKLATRKSIKGDNGVDNPHGLAAVVEARRDRREGDR